MDERIVQRVREHYASHANNGNSREALMRRRRGPALPLKRFHSLIKEKLIHRFCFGVGKVLDLCCGRGGDIRKWDISKVDYVKGIDLSEEEIREATNRLSEYKNTKNVDTQIEFESTDVLGKGLYVDSQAPFDVVTCFFALHYFTVTEAAINNLFLSVANNLKKGGYFICTCPDGKRVISALSQSKDRKRLQTPMITLVPRWSGSYQCFGSAFSCSITNTVTEDTIDTGGSYEYLVFTTPLKHIGAKYGLKLVSNYGDKHLDDLFDKVLQEDQDLEFKHFFPQFRDSDRSLHLASALNMAFVFQKVSDVQLSSDDPVEALEMLETTLPPSSHEARPALKRWIPQAANSQNHGNHVDKKPKRHIDGKKEPEDDDGGKGATSCDQ